MFFSNFNGFFLVCIVKGFIHLGTDFVSFHYNFRILDWAQLKNFHKLKLHSKLVIKIAKQK